MQRTQRQINIAADFADEREINRETKLLLTLLIPLRPWRPLR